MQNDDIKITLTNLGLVQRPDLTDSHTIHWHGFDMPSPLNDGVPEVSVAVPIGKQLTYFYRPHREGTYMYHCHFEDVEHVQMGMTGIVFVRPLQDGTSHRRLHQVRLQRRRRLDRLRPPLRDPAQRDLDERSTTATATSRRSIATDYDPQWFTLNGRCYPQTVLPNDDPTLPAATADRARTTRTTATRRLQPAELGADPGQPRRAGAAAAGQPRLPAARDAAARASRCTSSARTRRCCATATRRHLVLDEHPLHRARRGARRAVRRARRTTRRWPSGSDGRGNYNVYWFKNRDWRRLSNNGAARTRRDDDRGARLPERRCPPRPS